MFDLLSKREWFELINLLVTIVIIVEFFYYLAGLALCYAVLEYYLVIKPEAENKYITS